MKLIFWPRYEDGTINWQEVFVSLCFVLGFGVPIVFFFMLNEAHNDRPTTRRATPSTR
jgi:hypothetical protein